MARIMVVPEHLRALSNQLNQAADELHGLAGRASGAWANLDWEARQKAGAQAHVDEVRSMAGRLAEMASSLARFLSHKAQAFEEADRQGPLSLSPVAATASALFARHRWPILLPWPPRWRLPWRWLPFPIRRPRWPVIRPLPWPIVWPLPWPIIRPFPWPITILPVLPIVVKPLLDRFILFGSAPGQVPPDARSAGSPAESPEPAVAAAPQPPGRLNPAADPKSFSATDGCARYAQARRPDLGATGGAGGAADYIDKYSATAFQVTDPGADLTQRLTVGHAIVWPRGHGDLVGTAGEAWGHVAIVEQVGPDYVVVSQAGWGSRTTMRITREQLASLYVIP